MLSTKNRFKDRVVLITGASSGIGAGLARQFASEGADLVLTARRADRLEEVAADIRKLGRRALAIACDVTRDGDLEAAVERATRELGRIDVVVANAGFGVVGKAVELPMADFRRQFETNVFGVIRTVQASAPALVKSKGTLAIIGSVAGHVSLPGAAPYSMSKFAVRALASALRFELARKQVSVVLVSPGFVESEIRSVNNEGKRVEVSEAQRPGWLLMPTGKAARLIADGIARRKAEVVITAHGKLAVFLSRFAPWAIDLLVSRGMRGRRQLPDKS